MCHAQVEKEQMQQLPWQFGQQVQLALVSVLPGLVRIHHATMPAHYTASTLVLLLAAWLTRTAPYLLGVQC